MEELLHRGEVLQWVAVFLTLAVLVYIWFGLKDEAPAFWLTRAFWLKGLFVAWTLLPPVWFIYDWNHFRGSAPTPDQVEYFKYDQELARNLWIGVAALIGLLAGVSGKKE